MMTSSRGGPLPESLVASSMQPGLPPRFQSDIELDVLPSPTGPSNTTREKAEASIGHAIEGSRPEMLHLNTGDEKTVSMDLEDPNGLMPYTPRAANGRVPAHDEVRATLTVHSPPTLTLD